MRKTVLWTALAVIIALVSAAAFNQVFPGVRAQLAKLPRIF